jgi:hypothetical protein
MEAGGVAAKHKAGYGKFQASCKQAAKDGFQYIWIDTCCIDKRNSTELPKPINAMFRWYQRAEVCYVYLPDVKGVDDSKAQDEAFARCKWFTRGWTL